MDDALREKLEALHQSFNEINPLSLTTNPTDSLNTHQPTESTTESSTIPTAPKGRRSRVPGSATASTARASGPKDRPNQPQVTASAATTSTSTLINAFGVAGGQSSVVAQNVAPNPPSEEAAEKCGTMKLQISNTGQMTLASDFSALPSNSGEQKFFLKSTADGKKHLYMVFSGEPSKAYLIQALHGQDLPFQISAEKPKTAVGIGTKPTVKASTVVSQTARKSLPRPKSSGLTFGQIIAATVHNQIADNCDQLTSVVTKRRKLKALLPPPYLAGSKVSIASNVQACTLDPKPTAFSSGQSSCLASSTSLIPKSTASSTQSYSLIHQPPVSNVQSPSLIQKPISLNVLSSSRIPQPNVSNVPSSSLISKPIALNVKPSSLISQPKVSNIQLSSADPRPKLSIKQQVELKRSTVNPCPRTMLSTSPAKTSNFALKHNSVSALSNTAVALPSSTAGELQLENQQVVGITSETLGITSSLGVSESELAVHIESEQVIDLSQKTSEQGDSEETNPEFSEGKESPTENDDEPPLFKISAVFSLAPGATEMDNTEDDKAAGESEKNPISVEEFYDSYTQEEMRDVCGSSFTVLEQLRDSDLTEKGNVCDRVECKCSDYCRQRTLDFLCKEGLIWCPMRTKKRRIEKEITNVKQEICDNQATAAGMSSDNNNGVNNSMKGTPVKIKTLPLNLEDNSFHSKGHVKDKNPTNRTDSRVPPLTINSSDPVTTVLSTVQSTANTAGNRSLYNAETSQKHDKQSVPVDPYILIKENTTKTVSATASSSAVTTSREATVMSPADTSLLFSITDVKDEKTGTVSLLGSVTDVSEVPQASIPSTSVEASPLTSGGLSTASTASGLTPASAPMQSLTITTSPSLTDTVSKTVSLPGRITAPGLVITAPQSSQAGQATTPSVKRNMYGVMLPATQPGASPVLLLFDGNQSISGGSATLAKLFQATPALTLSGACATNASAVSVLSAPVSVLSKPESMQSIPASAKLAPVSGHSAPINVQSTPVSSVSQPVPMQPAKALHTLLTIAQQADLAGKKTAFSTSATPTSSTVVLSFGAPALSQLTAPPQQRPIPANRPFIPTATADLQPNTGNVLLHRSSTAKQQANIMPKTAVPLTVTATAPTKIVMPFDAKDGSVSLLGPGAGSTAGSTFAARTRLTSHLQATGNGGGHLLRTPQPPRAPTVPQGMVSLINATPNCSLKPGEQISVASNIPKSRTIVLSHPHTTNELHEKQDTPSQDAKTFVVQTSDGKTMSYVDSASLNNILSNARVPPGKVTKLIITRNAHLSSPLTVSSSSAVSASVSDSQRISTQPAARSLSTSTKLSLSSLASAQNTVISVAETVTQSKHAAVGQKDEGQNLQTDTKKMYSLPPGVVIKTEPEAEFGCPTKPDLTEEDFDNLPVTFAVPLQAGAEIEQPGASVCTPVVPTGSPSDENVYVPMDLETDDVYRHGEIDDTLDELECPHLERLVTEEPDEDKRYSNSKFDEPPVLEPMPPCQLYVVPNTSEQADPSQTNILSSRQSRKRKAEDSPLTPAPDLLQAHNTRTKPKTKKKTGNAARKIALLESQSDAEIASNPAAATTRKGRTKEMVGTKSKTKRLQFTYENTCGETTEIDIPLPTPPPSTSSSAFSIRSSMTSSPSFAGSALTSSTDRIQQLKEMLRHQNEQLEQIRRQRASQPPLVLPDANV